jgi:phospholipase C
MNYNILRLVDIHPRPYAVETRKNVTDILEVESSGVYSYRLLGPNGFVREFAGDVSAVEASGVSCAAPQVYVAYDRIHSALVFVMQNTIESYVAITLTVVDNAYNLTAPFEVTMSGGGSSREISLDISGSGRWYDFSVYVREASETTNQSTLVVSSACYHRRFAGMPCFCLVN